MDCNCLVLSFPLGGLYAKFDWLVLDKVTKAVTGDIRAVNEKLSTIVASDETKALLLVEKPYYACMVSRLRYFRCNSRLALFRIRSRFDAGIVRVCAFSRKNRCIALVGGEGFASGRCLHAGILIRPKLVEPSQVNCFPRLLLLMVLNMELNSVALAEAVKLFYMRVFAEPDFGPIFESN